MSARGERGQALAIVVVFMMAMLGFSALALDLSRSALVANEIQNAADVAATSAIKAQMGKTKSDPEQAALATLAANKANNETLGSANLQSLQLGNFDGTNFLLNVAPYNAARATTTTTFDNLLMRAFGSPSTTVTKQAMAMGSFVSAAVPTLPIVIGDCKFRSDCFEDSCMPRLSAAPSGATATAFTSFFDTGATASQVISFIPSDCFGAGGGRTTALKISDTINLSNGSTQPILNEINKCLANGRTKFLIPLVPCTGVGSGSTDVTGFATIVIDGVRTIGNPKGISLHAVYADTPGVKGGGSVNGGMATFSLIE